MLPLVSKTVFVSMCAPLITPYFGASAQLVSGELPSSHGGGGRADEALQESEVGWQEGIRRGREEKPVGRNVECDSQANLFRNVPAKAEALAQLCDNLGKAR